ncbi:hypothetical protein [Methyloceanibacter sp.]|uniref:hypothetical protein n=1 Tax=Methyloceanibacter sp. TaxID=1965321 RepID=UPI002BE3B34B|nr:hypothetical protein [Methyloceanibacter sp.]HML93408.1 hypothetical protein [Methyloceanibacter sp.]
MSKNWTDAELTNLETKVSALEASKASNPSGWWTGDRARASSMKATLLTNPPANVVADSLAQRHGSLVERLGRII